MVAVTSPPLPILLIPGAWMGSWIWDDTIARLREAGCVASSLTLSGLEVGADPVDVAGARLVDHVADVERAVRSVGRPLMIVGHSYSGLLAGIVADRRPDLVLRTTIVCGFYPLDGRSLLDDWGPDAESRAAERAAIEQAGTIWAPPPPEGIASDPGLDAEQAAWLGRRLQPHPGRTITDAVVMQRPITEQSVTVIADAGAGDARQDLPDDIADDDLSHWTFRSVAEGHWPMLGDLSSLVDHLSEAASAARPTDR